MPVFFASLNYYTQPWYYVTLAAFVAGNLDILIGAWTNSSRLRLVRPIIALALLGFVARPAWSDMKVRHTNADLVAARLEGISREGDLILMPRWECAIPLARYYHGPAEIVTLPPFRIISFIATISSSRR